MPEAANNLEKILEQVSGKLDEVQTGIKTLDAKVEDVKKDVSDLKIGMVKLEERLNGVSATLEAKIAGVTSRIDGVATTLEAKIAGATSTLEANLKQIDKRISNEEFISRSAFAALFAGALAGFVKYFFFSDRL